MGLVLAFLFLAAVVAAVLFQTRRTDFVVRFHQGRCTCKGRLAQQVALEQFLRDDLAIAGSIEIMGQRRKGRLVLWFNGELTRGQQQRIRNFLLTHR